MKGLVRRECFGYWLNEKGLFGDGAEIGSAQGIFARNILSQWRGKRLFMVDPWEKQNIETYREETNLRANFHDWHQQCLELEQSDHRALCMKMLSIAASRTISDNTLDFAYIDGNHAYGHVLEDMDLWWPKVKIGGIMGGHDFYNNTENGAWVEVEKAVLRWTKEHELAFTVTPCTSWWIEKIHP